MSTVSAIVATITVLAFVGAVVCWRMSLVLRRSLHRDQAADTVDVGPDALRLLEDLDAHLDEYVAADPELAAGFGRLRDAIRDEQQKGETQ